MSVGVGAVNEPEGAGQQAEGGFRTGSMWWRFHG